MNEIPEEIRDKIESTLAAIWIVRVASLLGAVAVIYCLRAVERFFLS